MARGKKHTPEQIVSNSRSAEFQSREQSIQGAKSSFPSSSHGRQNHSRKAQRWCSAPTIRKVT
jgi:hypothetical protein